MNSMRNHILSVLLAGASVLVSAAPVLAQEADTSPSAQTNQTEQKGRALTTIVPQLSAERGKQLFSNKACVVCHSVNGVGGKAASPLDAPDEVATIDVLAFAARMWRGADAMIVFQSMELGYQINLTGQEVADIAAFVYDKESQSNFTEENVPEIIRTWFLEDPIVIDEDMLAPD